MGQPALSVHEVPGRALGQLILAALWLGAAAFFALAVAPSAFAALPSRELAGALVGRVLPMLFWSGAAVGILLAALEAGSQRARRRGRLAAAGCVVASCLVAQLVVAPRISDIRSALEVPLASLAPADPRRKAFGRLHAVSVVWLGAAMIGALTVLVLAAPTPDRGRSP